MRVLTGKQETRLASAAFAALAARYETVELDVGAGDGRFVIDRAARHPERLIVGLDPVAEAMSAASNRVTRRRTRLDNALFVVASVEQMPPELTGLCNCVFINLPWGSLMRGLVLATPEILVPLAAVGLPGAHYRIILNLRVFAAPVPLEVQSLPAVTAEYVLSQLVAPYRAAGLEIVSVRLLEREDLDALLTTWSRRLSHQRPPPSIEIELQRTVKGVD